MSLFFWFDLSLEARAEILKVFCSYFGRNDDLINLFWDLLTFRVILVIGCKAVIYGDITPSALVPWLKIWHQTSKHQNQSVLFKKKLQRKSLNFILLWPRECSPRSIFRSYDYHGLKQKRLYAYKFAIH